MHTIYSISLVLFACISLMAQNTVQISATLQNAELKEVRFLVQNLYLESQVDTQVVKLTDDNFTHKLTIATNQIVDLYYGKEKLPLYLRPKQHLQIVAHADSLRASAKFTGDGAADNNFLQAFNQKFGQYYHPDSMKARLLAPTVTIDNVEMELFESSILQKKFLKNYKQFDELSDDLKALINNNIKYNYYNYLLGYPIIRANNNKKQAYVKRIPNVLLDNLSRLTLSNEAAMASWAYRSFVLYYVTYFTSAANGFYKFTDYGESLQMKYNTARQALEGVPYFAYISEYTLKNYEKCSPEVVKRVHKDLKNKDEEGKYANLIAEVCGKHMKKKTPAAMASKDKTTTGSTSNLAQLTLVDEKGKSVSLADFKGKVIYVDFWASWCGPCRKQFPHAKELKKKFSKKERKKIVFVYISIDSDENTWQKGIEKSAIQEEGVHLLSPGGWSSDAAKFFQLSSIPRYMLIDKKGNVVNKNAKRPSMQDEILEDIRQYL